MTSKRTMGDTIDKCIQDALKLKKSLNEVELKKGVDDDSKDRHPRKGSGKEKGVDHTEDQTKSHVSNNLDKYAMKTAPDVEQVVDKINLMRSGHSLNKDEEVREKFETYFRNLSKAEKVAMFVFFKSVSEILTIDIAPDETVEPSDVGLNVQKKQSDKPMTQPSGGKKTISNAVKAPSKQDTSAPVKVV